jgi:hypothetical protein
VPRKRNCGTESRTDLCCSRRQKTDVGHSEITLLVAWNGTNVRQICARMRQLPAQETRERIQSTFRRGEQPFQPFEICHMDLVGPFRVSANKNKYILTFIDKLTKYVEAVPIPDATAATCSREWDTRVVARHGAGQAVVTNRGASFMALFFNEVCKILGIRHLNTSAYHPQGNGFTGFHRTLHKSLSHYINASGTNWNTLLPFHHGLSRLSQQFHRLNTLLSSAWQRDDPTDGPKLNSKIRRKDQGNRHCTPVGKPEKKPSANL